MQVVALVVPIFLILLLGYMLRKLRFVDESFAGQLNRIAYHITLPVLLFTKTAAVEPSELLHAPTMVGYPLTVLAVGTFSGLLTIALARGQRGAFVQGAFRTNLAYLGLPIAVSALGESSTAIAAVIVATGTVTNTVLSIVALRLYNAAGGADVLRRLAGVVSNPLVIAIALGLLTATAGIELPAAIAATLELLARMSLPAILLVVGFSLSFTRIRADLGATITASLIKLALMPALAWLIMTALFNADDTTRAVVVLLAAMPTAITSQSFARAFDADESLTAGVVSLSTLLAVVTIPATIFILHTNSNL